MNMPHPSNGQLFWFALAISLFLIGQTFVFGSAILAIHTRESEQANRLGLLEQRLEQVEERQYRILQALDNTYNILNEHLRGERISPVPPLFPNKDAPR